PASAGGLSPRSSARAEVVAAAVLAALALLMCGDDGRVLLGQLLAAAGVEFGVRLDAALHLAGARVPLAVYDPRAVLALALADPGGVSAVAYLVGVDQGVPLVLRAGAGLRGSVGGGKRGAVCAAHGYSV